MMHLVGFYYKNVTEIVTEVCLGFAVKWYHRHTVHLTAQSTGLCVCDCEDQVDGLESVEGRVLKCMVCHD